MDENYVECLVNYLEEGGWTTPQAETYAEEHAETLKAAKHKPKCYVCGIWHDNHSEDYCNECEKG